MSLGTYHGLRRTHVDTYLNEFVFRYIAASTGTFRSKPCSGWPHIMRLRATGTSSNETILERGFKRSGGRLVAVRRPPECDRTVRRQHSAPAKINPPNQCIHYI